MLHGTGACFDGSLDVCVLVVRHKSGGTAYVNLNVCSARS